MSRERWLWRGIALVVFGTAIWLIQVPAIHHVREVNYTTKELSNAKQIYLALKMYERDHNGARPGLEDGGAVASSNEVFRRLIPDYLTQEKIFYSRRSPWTPKPPDGKMGQGRTLSAGENCFAYVLNVLPDSNKNFPLIASAFGKGSPGTYGWDPKIKRRAPEGRAIIVRNDGSGIATKIEEDGRVYDYGDVGSQEKIDLFKPAPGWLAPDQVPLNPK